MPAFEIKKPGDMYGLETSLEREYKINIITEIIKIKIKEHWDTSIYMKEDLESSDVIISKWKNEHTLRFLSCHQKFSLPLQGKTKEELINYYADNISKIFEPYSTVPIAWFDEGMLLVLEIIYNGERGGHRVGRGTSGCVL